jgi:LPS sulfotransferase NodH
MQPLVVLGMHRSGTSLIVRLLADMGIHMGSWLSRDAESIHFLGLNKRVYNETNSNWAQVDALIEAADSEIFVERQSQILERALFVEKLSDFKKHFNLILQAEAVRLSLSDDRTFVSQNAIVAVFFGSLLWEKVNQDEHFPWGWKDPRTTLTFPIWLRIFPNARFLHVLRNGIDVAISTHRRSQKQQQKIWKRLYPIDYSPLTLDFEYCFHLWEKYVSFVFDHKHLIPENHYLEIHYEDLLANPEEILRRIVEYIEFSIPDEVINTVCEQIDRSRLDNTEHAKPYEKVIPSLAAKPMMQQLGYGYSL